MAPKNQNENAGDNKPGDAGDEERPGRTVKLMSVNGIRRAGIRFPAGQEIPVDLDKLSEDQLKALEAEKELRPVR
nr:HI1506-related protein [uncultured Shinella sp.]